MSWTSFALLVCNYDRMCPILLLIWKPIHALPLHILCPGVHSSPLLSAWRLVSYRTRRMAVSLTRAGATPTESQSAGSKLARLPQRAGGMHPGQVLGVHDQPATAAAARCSAIPALEAAGGSVRLCGDLKICAYRVLSTRCTSRFRAQARLLHIWTREGSPPCQTIPACCVRFVGP